METTTLIYNPTTGWFTRNGKRAGSSDCCKGYRQVMWNSKLYKEHRLAWFFHYGEWPNQQIDHINEIKDDNRIINLRDVCQTVNMYNKSSAYKPNKTKYLGVGVSGNKYQARIRVNKKLIYLGTFETAQQANCVYTEFKDLVQQLV